MRASSKGVSARLLFVNRLTRTPLHHEALWNSLQHCHLASAPPFLPSPSPRLRAAQVQRRDFWQSLHSAGTVAVPDAPTLLLCSEDDKLAPAWRIRQFGAELAAWAGGRGGGGGDGEGGGGEFSEERIDSSSHGSSHGGGDGGGAAARFAPPPQQQPQPPQLPQQQRARVRLVCWASSEHVAHLRHHPRAYSDAVGSLLRSAADAYSASASASASRSASASAAQYGVATDALALARGLSGVVPPGATADGTGVASYLVPGMDPVGGYLVPGGVAPVQQAAAETFVASASVSATASTAASEREEVTEAPLLHQPQLHLHPASSGPSGQAQAQAQPMSAREFASLLVEEGGEELMRAATAEEAEAAARIGAAIADVAAAGGDGGAAEAEDVASLVEEQEEEGGGGGGSDGDDAALAAAADEPASYIPAAALSAVPAPAAVMAGLVMMSRL